MSVTVLACRARSCAADQRCQISNSSLVRCPDPDAARCSGRNSNKAAASPAAAATSVLTTEVSNGLVPNGAHARVTPPPSPKRSKAKRHLPAVDGVISYERWRSKYVREYRGGLYVAYNGKHHETPHNAVTVSEVRFLGTASAPKATYDRLLCNVLCILTAG